MAEERGETEMRFTGNFQVDECSVPEGMTLDEWRRANARPRKGFRARVRRLGRRGGRPAQASAAGHER